MALRLVLNELRLRTSTGESVYAFGPGLNVITGSYATGKSSMFELIKYALGAKKAELMPTISKRLLSTSLTVMLGRNLLMINREMGKNLLLVTFKNENDRLERWSATPIKSALLASDRILALLEVPNVRVARKGAKGSSAAVSFFDMYRYVYLPQADVPRSIAGHADPFLNPKRKAVLELAYGLSDEVLNLLKIDVVEYEKALDKAKVEAEAVTNFLERAGAPSRDELAVGIEAAGAALSAALTVFSESRRSAISAAAPSDQSELRDRIAKLRSLVADYESERLIAEVSVDRDAALLAQVQLDMQREHKAESAAALLQTYEFISCPRCLQHLPDRHENDHCILCGQEEPHHVPHMDTGTLATQLEEIALLLRKDEARAEAASRQSAIHQRLLSDVIHQFESQLDPELLMPSVDRVSSATSDLERSRAQLRELERFQDQWDTQAEFDTETTALRSKIAATLSAINESQEALARNRFRLESLGEYLQEEVRALGFGQDATADIDANYLPVINGDTFDQLSVAGARKVLANDAYYLASLSNALTDRDILLPALLIIDGPRTSLGDTVEDKRAGERLYYRFRVLTDFYEEAQILIADNGHPPIPPGERPVNVITLTYDKPLLQDVKHPGEGEVPTVGQTRIR